MLSFLYHVGQNFSLNMGLLHTQKTHAFYLRSFSVTTLYLLKTLYMRPKSLSEWLTEGPHNLKVQYWELFPQDTRVVQAEFSALILVLLWYFALCSSSSI